MREVPFGPGFEMANRGGPWHHAFPILHLMLMLVLIGLAIWLLIRVGRFTRPAGAGMVAAASFADAAVARDPALEELRLRYARGEMDHEEFLERSGDLGARPDAE